MSDNLEKRFVLASLGSLSIIAGWNWKLAVFSGPPPVNQADVSTCWRSWHFKFNHALIMCCCIRRASNNCPIVSRSEYIWIWAGARDQESTNHSARLVEWKSRYITNLRVPAQWIDSCHQPRYQGLSPLPPCFGRKSLVAAGHVTTCDTNFSTGVESTNIFRPSQLKRKKGNRWSSLSLVLL